MIEIAYLAWSTRLSGPFSRARGDRVHRRYAERMELDLPRLRAFVVTADELSFTRAAEILGIAQPSLSERIRRLEDDLGVTLISRERRQIALTAAGLELLHRARPLLAAADQTITDVRLVDQSGTALRRMALSSLAAGVDEFKAGIIVAVRERAPDLAVTLTTVSFSDHLRVVQDGRVDAAFIWPPYSVAALAGLHVQTLCDFPRLLAVSARHPLGAAGQATLAQLAGLTQIPLAATVDPVFVASSRLVSEPVLASAERVDTVAELIDAVAAGAGVCPVPALLARTAVNPDVAFVPIVDAPPAALALAWRRDRADERHHLLARVATTLR